MMTDFKDQIGRNISIPTSNFRIVSLVPSITELICDLGLRENLVGITKFCVHPENIRKEIKVVGGTKKVHISKIQDLHPNIILCNKEENTEEMILKLEKICAVHVSEVIEIKDVFDLINDYGKIFKIQIIAQKISDKLKLSIEQFQKKLDLSPKRVAYLIWKNPWMVAGSETFINTLLELNGWQNIFKSSPRRYPEIGLEELRSKKPDIVLLSTEPFPFSEKHIFEIGEFTKAKIVIADGEYFSWYGTRLFQAFPYFHQLQSTLQ